MLHIAVYLFFTNLIVQKVMMRDDVSVQQSTDVVNTATNHTVSSNNNEFDIDDECSTSTASLIKERIPQVKQKQLNKAVDTCVANDDSYQSTVTTGSSSTMSRSNTSTSSRQSIDMEENVNRIHHHERFKQSALMNNHDMYQKMELRQLRWKQSSLSCQLHHSHCH